MGADGLIHSQPSASTAQQPAVDQKRLINRGLKPSQKQTQSVDCSNLRAKRR